LSERQDPKLAGRKVAEFKNILRGIVFCACGSGFRYHAQKREYVDLVCSASLAGRCTYASPWKGVRYRYARIEEIFLAYQSLIPFHRIIPKPKDIKSLENEKQELAGKILQQEKSLASNFDILTNASETAKKYILSKIEEVAHDLDQLKAKHNEISLRISSLHLASKSMLNVMGIYKLLLNEHGRMRVNNFLIGQNVRITITPTKKNISSWMFTWLMSTLTASVSPRMDTLPKRSPISKSLPALKRTQSKIGHLLGLI